MLPQYFLDWAIRAVSIFNTITLLWLGLTILLNAERRRWGTWVAAGGLLLGGIFFAAHSAVVGLAFGALYTQISFWWHLIWLPFIFSSYLWYLVIIWYTGMLRTGRHSAWLWIVSLLGLLALGLLLFAPSYKELTHQPPASIFSVEGVPAIMLIYPLYSVLCIVLSLSALRRPAGSDRFMGALAQQRARPWLIAASFVLLGVSLCVGSVALWLLEGLEAREVIFTSPSTQMLLINFDVLISALIAIAVVCMGQGMVSYEIFTGKALPRGGLARHWRNSLILAAGYGALVSASLNLPVDPIYPLVLATLIMTTFYALLSWRSYAERERSMERLRPFVASQRLYERLLKPAVPAEVDVATPFRALCEGVLGARVAYLAAVGPLAPLAGPVLAYPDSASCALHMFAAITAQFHSPQEICVPLDPAHYGGAVWAVPLWSERGLIGILLLGNKRDGSLYTQEEIEIARATGERLIDTQASAEMARRLMALQRERLAESQILDQHTRRVLHDDVLAHLHTAMLKLSTAQAGNAETAAAVIALLGEIHHEIANLLHAMPITTTREVARLGLIGALRQVVETEQESAFDGVTWQVEQEAASAAQRLSPLPAEVLFCAAREAIRNAARYGRNGEKSRPLRLTLSVAWHDGLQVVIEDNGVGLGAAGPDLKGSGEGLALHSTMMTVIGGALTAESSPAGATRVVLTLPQEVSYAQIIAEPSTNGSEQPEPMPGENLHTGADHQVGIQAKGA
jgi:signal transduction histidine kinase